MLNTTTVTLVDRTDDGRVLALAIRRDGYADRGYSGITFEVPAETKEALLSTESGLTLEAPVFGPDDEGRWWASVPLRRLPRMNWRQLAQECGLSAPSDI